MGYPKNFRAISRWLSKTFFELSIEKCNKRWDDVKTNKIIINLSLVGPKGWMWTVLKVDGRAKLNGPSKSGRSWAKPDCHSVSWFKIVHLYFFKTVQFFSFEPFSFIPLDHPILTLWTVHLHFLRSFSFILLDRLLFPLETVQINLFRLYSHFPLDRPLLNFRTVHFPLEF